MRAAKTMQRGREHEKDNGSTLVLALMPQLQRHYPSIAPGSQLAQVHAVGSGLAELNQAYWPMIVFIAFMRDSNNQPTPQMLIRICYPRRYARNKKYDK